jgi:hypothetical protein
VDNPLPTIHSFHDLSTGSVDNHRFLWISRAFQVVHKYTNRICLWINLWIKGVKAVDKSVDNFVDNFTLWITRDLSTICPQENAGYPQFLPQAAPGVMGLGKVDFCGYPHIHRPYYYY